MPGIVETIGKHGDGSFASGYLALLDWYDTRLEQDVLCGVERSLKQAEVTKGADAFVAANAGMVMQHSGNCKDSSPLCRVAGKKRIKNVTTPEQSGKKAKQRLGQQGVITTKKLKGRASQGTDLVLSQKLAFDEVGGGTAQGGQHGPRSVSPSGYWLPIKTVCAPLSAFTTPFFCGEGGRGKGGLTPSRNGTFLFVIRAKRTICPQKDAVPWEVCTKGPFTQARGLLSRIMVSFGNFPKGRRPFGGKWFFWKFSQKDGVLLGQMVLFVFMKDHFFRYFLRNGPFTQKGCRFVGSILIGTLFLKEGPCFVVGRPLEKGHCLPCFLRKGPLAPKGRRPFRAYEGGFP